MVVEGRKVKTKSTGNEKFIETKLYKKEKSPCLMEKIPNNVK